MKNKNAYDDLILWLQNKTDFNIGLSLYEKYGYSANMKKILRLKGKTTQTMNDLIYELTKITNEKGLSLKKNIKINNLQATTHFDEDVKKPIINKPIIKEEIFNKFEKPFTEYDYKDDQIKRLIEAKNKMFKLYVSKFHSIEYLPPEKRRITAIEILTLWDQIADYWNEIDYLEGNIDTLNKKTSKLPKKSVNQMDKVDLLKQQINLRTYISKYKRLVNSSKSVKTRIKNENQLNKYVIQLQEIENKILNK